MVVWRGGWGSGWVWDQQAFGVANKLCVAAYVVIMRTFTLYSLTKLFTCFVWFSVFIFYFTITR